MGVAGVDVEPGPDHVDEFAHHARAFASDLRAPGAVDRQQSASPREILDRMHCPALPPRVLRRCVGKDCGFHSHSVSTASTTPGTYMRKRMKKSAGVSI